MKPVHCRVKHDPPHTHGDCLRACVCTIMELEPEHVDHFAEGDPDTPTLVERMRTWGKRHGVTPYVISYPGVPIEELLAFVGSQNPTAPYILIGGTEDGSDHSVVCRGDHIAWNPAWAGGWITGPASSGMWDVILLVRL